MSSYTVNSSEQVKITLVLDKHAFDELTTEDMELLLVDKLLTKCLGSATFHVDSPKSTSPEPPPLVSTDTCDKPSPINHISYIKRRKRKRKLEANPLVSCNYNNHEVNDVGNVEPILNTISGEDIQQTTVDNISNSDNPEVEDESENIDAYHSSDDGLATLDRIMRTLSADYTETGLGDITTIDPEMPISPAVLSMPNIKFEEESSYFEILHEVLTQAEEFSVQTLADTSSVPGPKVCPLCSFGPRTHSELKRHVRSAHCSLHPYRCGLCKRRYKLPHGLRAHLKSAHPVFMPA